ncbi:hypothetical protein FFWV33_05370 [Flavobacterium faecale]|uniref:SCP domain-containing protein n=1 Tax=Flavobacterium faecale TaxID=1355330 RepID=A0A2S1LBT1_9FLAO|nr:CAP domain-containing protein [Flavobacterium faecale]AWG21006.1 hypothetical protein FFWV33_05370 [Flavobacterium faecale]
MKAIILPLLLTIFSLSMNSCSSEDASPVAVHTNKNVIINQHNYDTLEIETLELINAYRASKGLNNLEKVDYASLKSEEHCDYMIAENKISHNDFTARCTAIIKTLGAEKVAENLAYNFNSSQAVLSAWLNSESHKQNIEGDFTHFGIAIKECPKTGKKYYTNIYVKL